MCPPIGLMLWLNVGFVGGGNEPLASLDLLFCLRKGPLQCGVKLNEYALH